jgi:uncharacterized protein YlxP (DUF503 family)
MDVIELKTDIASLREMVERLKQQLTEEICETTGQDQGTTAGQGVATTA